MLLRDQDGRLIDAELSVESLPGPGRFAIILESAGGTRGTSGSRNVEYPYALALILRRLAGAALTLDDALVDSRLTAHLAEHDRRLTPVPWKLPLSLATVEDFDALRHALTRGQSRIGSSASKGGNERRRLRLVISGAAALQATDLIRALDAVDATWPVRSSGVAVGVDEVAVRAAIGEWRTIGRDAFLARHGVAAAQQYVIVDQGEDFDAIAILRAARTHAGLKSDGRFRGDRRSVAEPLRALGFAVDNLESPSEGPLGPDPAAYIGKLAELAGETDGWTLRSYRREQRWLKGALGIGTGDLDRPHPCGLCGRSVPERLIVAAHIKPRRDCSRAERLDINVVFPACALGCDALFEHGYVSVDDSGQVIVADLAIGADHLVGQRAPAWTAATQLYFAWHRAHRFRGWPLGRSAPLPTRAPR